MKNLNITMTVKATSTSNAEQIAMHELMNLAKTVSLMGSGSGNATHISDCMYEVKANVSVATDISNENIANTMTQAFMKSADVVSCFVYVEPETPKKKCYACGKMLPVDELNEVIDVNGESRYVCNDCVDDELSEGNIELCPTCETYVSELLENPATHNRTICPCCGHNI